MNKRITTHWFSAIGLVVPLFAGGALAADVRVMISAGFYGAYSQLGPAFERASGHHIITVRGPSISDSPEAIPTRLTRDGSRANSSPIGLRSRRGP